MYSIQRLGWQVVEVESMAEVELIHCGDHGVNVELDRVVVPHKRMIE